MATRRQPPTLGWAGQKRAALVQDASRVSPASGPPPPEAGAGSPGESLYAAVWFTNRGSGNTRINPGGSDSRTATM